MIIQLAPDIRPDSLQEIRDLLSQHVANMADIQTQRQRYLVGILKNVFDLRKIGSLEGVIDVHHVAESYQLVSRQWKVQPTCIDLGDGVKISEDEFSVMIGPCSIENESQVDTIIQYMEREGIRIIRGGVYKPRSSPYAFRGLGMEGLKMLHSRCVGRHIKIITEVMQVSQIEPMAPYVDIFQVGARNTQNFNLLDALGQIDKPVLIKRGISGTIDELLQSAEYVFAAGNEKILLCERGIRTFETASRNTFDINAIPLLKEKSHLPVIADPSHGIGIRRFVPSIALAAMAAGADGVLLEVHPEPEKAISDGAQTLNFEEFSQLHQQIKSLFGVLPRYQKPV